MWFRFKDEKYHVKYHNYAPVESEINLQYLHENPWSQTRKKRENYSDGYNVRK